MRVMGRDDIYPVRMSKFGCLLHYVLAYLGLPTHDLHQWLLLQLLVLLMMEAESVRNM